MGCLNSEGQFSHWFGNIHLSGPCNRACYFCIGQHMMALDALDVLDVWPLPGITEFLAECCERRIGEINLTGTNTDPMMYAHMEALTSALRVAITGVRLGLRTNGAIVSDDMWLFDKISLSVHSFDPAIYRRMMGSGSPPDIARIRNRFRGEMKLNVVLGPENVPNGDILNTIRHAVASGIKTINLREPYGQPHVGDPLCKWGFSPASTTFGMPTYAVDGASVTYWDVHYVEVESVNLYASGRVSVDYPITRGYAPTGDVKGQEHFIQAGRVRAQWLGVQ